jgi:hypothetical protein
MKVRKAEIQLSPEHPSALLTLKPQSIAVSPLVLDANGILLDGYRRYQLLDAEFVEAVEVDAQNVFDAAYEINLHTRTWDELDCFLWARWALAIGGNAARLPINRFSSSLQSVSKELLILMAERKISMRKAILIQEAPPATREFFADLLANVFRKSWSSLRRIGSS